MRREGGQGLQVRSVRLRGTGLVVLVLLQLVLGLTGPSYGRETPTRRPTPRHFVDDFDDDDGAGEDDVEFLGSDEEYEDHEDDILTGRKTAQQVQEEIERKKAERMAKEEQLQSDESSSANEVSSDVEHEPPIRERRGEVVTLTKRNFANALATYPFVLVEFIAPWCGHCRKLAPEFEAAARRLAPRKEILFAKVDCTVDEELALLYDIRGYPTVKFFRHGKYIMEYELGRTAEDIVAFMKQKSKPATRRLSSLDEVVAFRDAHPNCLFIYALPNSDALLSVRDAANRPIVEEFSFAEVSDPKLIKSLGEKVNTAKIFRNFSEPYLLTNPTPETVLAAVLTHGYPYVGNGPDSWNRVIARKKPVVILFLDKDAEDAKDIFAWYNKIGQARIENFAFLYAGKEFHSRLTTLGASGDKIPTVVVVDPETTKSWPFEETLELNQQNVEALLDDVADGSVRPHYASQKRPPSNSGVVLTVVGDTFEELVIKNDKHVIVEFYAPWCGHCKQLAPTWEKLGEHYKNNRDVIVAQIDASANDNPSVVVKGYPSIFLFPAGRKDSPIEYKGLTRNLQDFISFVDENIAADGEEEKKEEEEHHGHDHDDL